MYVNFVCFKSVTNYKKIFSDKVLMKIMMWFMRPRPRVWGNMGKGVFISGGTGEQRSNFEGNRGTKTILGSREHKKTFFYFGGTG